MPRSPRSLLARLLRRLPSDDADRLPDADLVSRFATDRDQAAFELLVWRHGGLVLGVCRRILRDEHLAEDAFQATFLVLARKASSVKGRNVAGWLHQVARRVSVRAAKKRTKRTALEGAFTSEPITIARMADRDWVGVLDAEVGRLPDRFRLPVLLCYLQDYTTDEAARVLGVPRGTVLSRLSTARQRLAARLTRRGVALPATLVSATVASNQLVSATVRSAALFAAGDAVLTSAPTILATEVIRMSAWKLPAAVAAAIVLTAGVGTSVAVWATEGHGGQDLVTQTKPADPPKVQGVPAAETEAQRKARRDSSLTRISEFEKSVLTKIEELDKKRQAALQEMGDDVDIKALIASLERIDSQILTAETHIETAESELTSAQERARNPRVGIVDNVINQMVSNDNGVQASGVKVQLWEQRLTELSKMYAQGVESPLIKDAKGEVDKAKEVLAEAKMAARTKAEKTIEENRQKAAQDYLQRAESSHKTALKSLDTYKKRRSEMVKRIARARQVDGANQMIEDELRVYREVRQQLLRQRLMLQIDIEGISLPQSIGLGSDARVDQLIQDVYDLKADVRRLLETVPATTQTPNTGRGNPPLGTGRSGGRGGRGDQ